MLAATSALAATGALPLRDPGAVALASGASAIGAVALAGVLAAGRRAVAAATLLAILALSASGAPPVLVAGSAVVAVNALVRRRPGERAARTAAWLMLASLAVASLRHTFDPLLIESWLHRWTVGLLTGSRYSAEVAPSVYGLFSLPAGIAGAMAATERGWLRALGCTALVAALFVSRHLESAWPVAAAVLAVPAYLLRFSGESDTYVAAKPPPRRMRTSEILWGAVATALLVAGAAATTFSTGRAAQGASERPARIAIIGARHGRLEPLPPPSVAPKDYTAEPRFAAFRDRLEARGALTADIATPEELGGREWDAFVTINFSGEEADGFVEPLRERVRAGADLLVLADHTDMFGQMETTRALLAGTGIELAFDSAVPSGLGAGWLGCLAAGRNPIFGPHRSGTGSSWGVGCSLQVERPARVIAAGTRAFRDRGDRSKQGGLGNLARDREEGLGGFPLAACSELGRGEVLVCGDTSAVQDTALLAGSPFAARIERWLVEGGSFGGPGELGGSRWLAAAVLVMLALACFRVEARTIFALAAVGTLGLGEVWFEHRVERTLADREPPAADVVVLSGNAPGVALGVDRAQPLVELLGSLGMSVRTERAAEVEPGATLVLLDPWSPIDEDESKRVLAHVRSGGKLLLSVGERGARSAAPLLDALGLEVAIPLGSGLESAWRGPLAERPGAPVFHSARELHGAGLRGAEVVATCFRRPVAVAGTLGNGRWLVVADPGFALEKHVDVRRGGTHPGARTAQYLLELLADRDADSGRAPDAEFQGERQERRR